MNKHFWHRNGSTILTVLGCVGVVATSVMAAKATPKAMRIIEEAKEEKGDELTKWETIRVAGPSYIPSILIGASSIACIFGANILNKHTQAGLASAYALLDQTHKEYKRKTIELYGDDADDKIREEMAKDHYDEDGFQNGEESDNKILYYDEFSHRYFRATSEDVVMAEYKINKMLSEDYHVYLNEFYELLGLPITDYGDRVGWNSAQMIDVYWSSWIDFRHEKFETDDGLEGYIIAFTEPMLNSEDY